jgi:hypothetical protein
MATARPLIIGPSTGPEAPYPLRMEGIVIRGFRRGSKELGIPTANLPVDDSLTPWIADIKSGVYFGWASLRLPPSHPNQPNGIIRGAFRVQHILSCDLQRVKTPNGSKDVQEVTLNHLQ